MSKNRVLYVTIFEAQAHLYCYECGIYTVAIRVVSTEYLERMAEPRNPVMYTAVCDKCFDNGRKDGKPTWKDTGYFTFKGRMSDDKPDYKEMEQKNGIETADF